MKSWVSASVSLSNGETPGIVHEASGTVLIDGQTVEFVCRLVGGGATVDLHSLGNLSADDARRVARAVLEHGLLARVIEEGVGLSVTFGWVIREGETAERTSNDHSPAVDVPYSAERVQALMGMAPLFRFAVRDFNSGLLDREDAPLYFYRAIETLAKAVTGLDETNREVWDEFHRKLGTSRADLAGLERLADLHRHGSHLAFNADEHLEMMATAMRFLRLASHHVPLQEATELAEATR